MGEGEGGATVSHPMASFLGRLPEWVGELNRQVWEMGEREGLHKSVLPKTSP